MHIYHITSQSDWEAALTMGQYTAPSLLTEGFIHASTREQVVDTANRYYHGQYGIVLLVIDPEKTAPEIRYEAVELRGQTVHFPHIYGPLNLEAVAEVIAFPPGEDGVFQMPG